MGASPAHRLWPFIMSPCEVRRTRVAKAAGLEPASGSVRAKLPMQSPRARAGR